MLTKDTENKGWFSVPRSLFACEHSPITQDRPFTEFEARIWLLANANYAERQAGDITVKPGQILTSVRSLAKTWKWGLATVHRFLISLEQQGWIGRHPSKKRTLITICDEWNGMWNGMWNGERNGKMLDVKPNSGGEWNSKWNDKWNDERNYKNNNKKNKYIYTPIFEAFWDAYPRKVEKRRAFKAWTTRLREGHDPADLIAAAKNYALAVKGREPEYIKHPATFLGPSLPFEEYVNWRPPQKQCINTAMHLSGRSLGTLRQCGCEECSAELERRMREGGASPPSEEYTWRPPRRKCFNVGLPPGDRSLGMLEGCGCEECSAELERRRKEGDDGSEA